MISASGNHVNDLNRVAFLDGSFLPLRFSHHLPVNLYHQVWESEVLYPENLPDGEFIARELFGVVVQGDFH